MLRNSTRQSVRISFPLTDVTAFGFLGSRSLRTHFPQLAEFLEDWYDRSAERCDLFVNISEIDKYSVTCTVCRHFESQGCGSDDLKGPSIIKLLEIAYKHDSSP